MLMYTIVKKEKSQYAEMHYHYDLNECKYSYIKKVQKDLQ